MLYSRRAGGTVDEVTKRVEEATVANKFGVMGAHDLKAKMAEKGVEFAPQCRILEICQPMQAKNVLEAEMAISTALPCRISIYEENGGVQVSTIRPTALLEMFQRPELNDVAREVEETIVRIIDTACG